MARVARGLVDWRAIGAGAAAAAGVVVPAALIGNLVADAPEGEDPSNIVFVFFALVLVGFVFGGFVAARRTPDAPYTNAALAAVCAFLPLQLLALLVQQIGGDAEWGELETWVQLAFNASAAYGSGLLGGLVASKGRVGQA